MKKYLHFIVAAGVLIPLLTGAQVPPPSSYSIPFHMDPIACPSFGGLPSQKMWVFSQLTEPKEVGRCFNRFSPTGSDLPVYSWQSFLNSPDTFNYTVGAGVAACQRAACALHIGSGAGSATAVAVARAALAARNAPLAASLPAPEARPCFR